MTSTDFRDCAIAVFLLSLSAPIWLTAAGEIWMWWTWRPLEPVDREDPTDWNRHLGDD